MPTSATGIRPIRAPRRSRSGHPASRRSSLTGFTLIEMLAVVVIMGGMLALIVPNLGFRQASALRDEARSLAAQIELTRQLAVVTGKPHRLLLDIEAGSYSIERFGQPLESDVEDPEAIPAVPIRGGYDLSPPKSERLEYAPVDNQVARRSELDVDFFFEGLETSEGWLDSGLVHLVFDADGTTDPAELVVSDLDGRMVVLEVRPLLDRVVVRDAAN